MKLDKDRPIIHWLGGLVLLGALAAYLHPYFGIRHDAVLYLGQALLYWDPAQYRSDLFFAYGGQTQFSVFPPLVAHLIHWWSAAEVFRVSAALAILGFVLASAYLIWQFFPGRERYFALLAVVLMPGGYGAWRVFAYGEAFFTARSVAEPLVLLALAAWFTGARLPGLALCGIAAMLHPLQTLPGLVALWTDLVRADRRWLHLLWGVLPVAVLSVAGSPFDLVLRRIDTEWLAWLAEASPHLLPRSWAMRDWCYLTTDLFLGWLLLRRSEGGLLRITKAIITSALLGTLATLFLADLLRLWLPAALQLWRAHWLLHWLVMAAIPFLLLEEYRSQGRRSPKWWSLVTICALGVPAGDIAPAPIAITLLIPFYLAWDRLSERVRPGLRKALGRALALLPLALLAKFVFGAVNLIQVTPGGADAPRIEFLLLSFPLVAGALAASLILLWQRIPNWRFFLLAGGAAALFYALQDWDRRSTWTRYIESAQHSPELFGVRLEEGAQVYWAEELVAPWLILHRPAFFNGHHAAGLVFSRDTGREYDRRRRAFEPLLFQQHLCRIMDSLNTRPGECRLSETVVADICREFAGELRYLVLERNMESGPPPLGTWAIRGGQSGERDILYRLYRCADLSNESAATHDSAAPSSFGNEGERRS